MQYLSEQERRKMRIAKAMEIIEEPERFSTEIIKIYIYRMRDTDPELEDKLQKVLREKIEEEAKHGKGKGSERA